MAEEKQKEEILPKKKGFFRKKKNIAFLLIGIGIISWIAYGATKEATLNLRTAEAMRGELVQEVSVTGSVKPAEKVSLGFEISGKVAEIFADIGDRVEVGDKLISLSSNDLAAQLRQAQAGVSNASASLQQYKAALTAQESKLDEMKNGTRPEEIRIAETSVSTAEKSLEDAEKNLNLTQEKAEADLSNTYSNTLLAMLEAVVEGKKAIITLTDIQYAHFRYNDQDKYLIENAKRDAVQALLGETNGGDKTVSQISRMNGGVFGEVQNMGINAEAEAVEKALTNTLNALQKIKYALDIIPITTDFLETEISELDAEKSLVNSELTTLSNQKNLIEIQKVTNQNLINTAQTQVNNAENALKAAEDQLALKRAGYTSDQIKAQEAAVNQAKANLSSAQAQLSQAQANLQNYQAQYDKTILYAPIAGLVTKMEAKVGEIVFPSSPYSDSRTTFVSIISDSNYEIEASIAEVDIAKIKIGDFSRVTLDAYGDDKEFQAVVTEVDPAETIVEGIPTYKITLQFTEEAEEIKSGMTANLDILTEKLEDVIYIPQRTVIERDGKKIVRIYKDSGMPITNENQLEEVEVLTGLKSSDGNIEVTDGIKEGDTVVISID
jgi:RND family efflux transporter MFP subunit